MTIVGREWLRDDRLLPGVKELLNKAARIVKLHLVNAETICTA